jgi:hypothetical protein
MSRFTSIKRLAIAGLAAAGVAAACRGAMPGEAPPLAPRPDIGPSSDPVPGAPDPIDPPDPGTPGPKFPTEDAGPAPILPTPPGPISFASADPMQGRDAGPDARPRDAAVDAVVDAAIDAPAPDAAPDAAVPDARDSGVGLPPVPDAVLGPDALTPLR